MQYGRTEMQRRWDVLKSIEASSSRFEFQASSLLIAPENLDPGFELTCWLRRHWRSQ